MIDEELEKRAKLRCMNLLKTRDYTKHQLEDKLRANGYTPEVIDKALEYVMSYGYVDDLRYAISYIRYKSRAKSSKQIKNELMQKGVSKEDIEAAYMQCIEDESLTDEKEVIERLIAKKKFDKETATYEEKQKIIAFLYRKGFHLDIIYKAVE